MTGMNRIEMSRPNSWIGELTPIVYIVDDDGSVCDSLRRLIRAAGWQPSICASAEEFLASPRTLGPCCLLADAALPGLAGLDLRQLMADRVEMPSIFITGERDVATAVRVLKAGAVDLLTKPFVEKALLDAITLALERSKLALRLLLEKEVLRSRYTSLSLRERQVMALVIAGRRNKHVGRVLGITETTVKIHRGNAMRKMNARSLAELVKFAARLNEGSRLSGGAGRKSWPSFGTA
jgi:FixJ family two-component response regulator